MKIPLSYWFSPTFWYLLVKELIEKLRSPSWYMKICPECGVLHKCYVPICFQCFHSNGGPGWESLGRNIRLLRKGFISLEEYQSRLADLITNNSINLDELPR